MYQLHPRFVPHCREGPSSVSSFFRVLASGISMSYLTSSISGCCLNGHYLYTYVTKWVRIPYSISLESLYMGSCSGFMTIGSCYIIFFCQLNAILVIALLNAIAEAVSDNRELTRVFHQIISSDFKVIASASFYCIRSSRYFHSS